MQIVIERIKRKPGDNLKEWKASAEGLVSGVGNSRAEALDSLVRSNLQVFGITSWIDRDWRSETLETRWDVVSK